MHISKPTDQYSIQISILWVLRKLLQKKMQNDVWTLGSSLWCHFVICTSPPSFTLHLVKCCLKAVVDLVMTIFSCSRNILILLRCSSVNSGWLPIYIAQTSSSHLWKFSLLVHFYFLHIFRNMFIFWKLKWKWKWLNCVSLFVVPQTI